MVIKPLDYKTVVVISKAEYRITRTHKSSKQGLNSVQFYSVLFNSAQFCSILLWGALSYLRVDLCSGSFTDPIVTQYGSGGSIIF